MRSRRLSSFIIWTAIALLAIAGFATFANPDATSDEVRVEAAAASVGHTSGAYAGVAFAYMPSGEATTASGAVGNPDQAEPSSPAGFDEVPPSDGSPPDADEAGPADSISRGTIASPTAGWLSEVEVRAIISLFFEAEDVNRAIRVAWCESRFDPESIDRRTGGAGLFHHLPRYWEE